MAIKNLEDVFIERLEGFVITEQDISLKCGGFGKKTYDYKDIIQIRFEEQEQVSIVTSKLSCNSKHIDDSDEFYFQSGTAKKRFRKEFNLWLNKNNCKVIPNPYYDFKNDYGLHYIVKEDIDSSDFLKKIGYSNVDVEIKTLNNI